MMINWVESANSHNLEAAQDSDRVQSLTRELVHSVQQSNHVGPVLDSDMLATAQERRSVPAPAPNSRYRYHIQTSKVGNGRIDVHTLTSLDQQGRVRRTSSTESLAGCKTGCHSLGSSATSSNYDYTADLNISSALQYPSSPGSSAPVPTPTSIAVSHNPVARTPLPRQNLSIASLLNKSPALPKQLASTSQVHQVQTSTFVALEASAPQPLRSHLPSALPSSLHPDTAAFGSISPSTSSQSNHTCLEAPLTRADRIIRISSSTGGPRCLRPARMRRHESSSDAKEHKDGASGSSDRGSDRGRLRPGQEPVETTADDAVSTRRGHRSRQTKPPKKYGLRDLDTWYYTMMEQDHLASLAKTKRHKRELSAASRHSKPEEATEKRRRTEEWAKTSANASRTSLSSPQPTTIEVDPRITPSTTASPTEVAAMAKSVTADSKDDTNSAPLEQSEFAFSHSNLNGTNGGYGYIARDARASPTRTSGRSRHKTEPRMRLVERQEANNSKSSSRHTSPRRHSPSPEMPAVLAAVAAAVSTSRATSSPHRQSKHTHRTIVNLPPSRSTRSSKTQSRPTRHSSAPPYSSHHAEISEGDEPLNASELEEIAEAKELSERWWRDLLPRES